MLQLYFRLVFIVVLSNKIETATLKPFLADTKMNAGSGNQNGGVMGCDVILCDVMCDVEWCKYHLVVLDYQVSSLNHIAHML
jgi:hypothetical protein